MSKRRRLTLIDGDRVHQPPPVVRWDRCIICQEDTQTLLINAKETDLKSLGEDLIAFNELGALPKSVPFSQLDDGQGIVESLISHSAKFHKICRTKCDKQKLERQRKRELLNDSSASTSSEEHTRSSNLACNIKNSCLFCDGGGTDEKLVAAQTMEIGSAILFLAKELQDDKILSKLSSTDLVAQEAKYHKRCYVRFRTRARSEQRKNNNVENKTEMYNIVYGSALSQMTEYIEDMYLNMDTCPVFKLAVLTSQMEAKMRNLGIADPQVHRSKLKDQLTSSIPGLVSCKTGREVILYFKESTGDAIRDAIAYDSMSDGMCLAHAAKIIRKDLFNEYPKFTGSFSGEFVPKHCVNKPLLLLLQMILEGSDPSNDEKYERTAVLSLAQLVRFNAVKSKRRHAGSNVKHHVDRETPLPLYIGLKMYSTVRSKNLIDHLWALGLSVSYDRVQYVLSTVTNVISESYETSQGVFPASLHCNTFTTAVIDNIDHNQSSTSAQSSFHGTSITLIQHPDARLPDKTCLQIRDSQWSRRVTKELPHSYTVITPTSMYKYYDIPLKSVVTLVEESQAYSSTVNKWLNTVKDHYEADDDEMLNRRLSWSAFTSESKNTSKIPISNQILLPLLNEKVQSPAVVAHCLKVTLRIFDELRLNGGIPVLTGDQPIYALAKQLQWRFPHLYGEDKIVVMMGGLHIEMAVMSMIGSWLTGSGWIDILVDAGVASTGRAESFLTCSHVKRTRYAHQVTAAALTILKAEAYEARDLSSDTPDLNYDEWCSRRIEESAQFIFWSITIELEVLLLSYLQSVREGNFVNFTNVLGDICPWLFALDRTNYARWLPVFVKTLQVLEQFHPCVHKEFMKGKFVSQKTNRSFSAIADDQLHEQNNTTIKEIGGAIGLLDNPTALLKWMVGGPDIVKMIATFEKQVSVTEDEDQEEEEENEIDEKGYPEKHRENTKSFEKRFRKDVLTVVTSFQKYGNPFEDDKLSTAVSNICMTADAEKSVREAKDKGKYLYESYIQERFVEGKTSIHAVIKLCNLALFNEKRETTKSKLQMQIKDLKKDANVFCKLYVASQIRETDVSKVFAHENHPYPPSISEFGRLRKATKKSDVITCLLSESQSTEEDEDSVTCCSAVVIDGAALVHSLNAKTSKTFSDYCTKVFLPAINSRLLKFERVDVVFDRYVPGSLKADTRLKRGSGKDMVVRPTTPMPKMFSKFLQVDGNKKQLFHLIATFISSLETNGKLVVCTDEESVTSAGPLLSSDDLAPCSHEEADTRLLVHVKSALLAGHKNIVISTVDSDVVVIAAAAFHDLKELGMHDLWIEYGVGKNRRHFSLSMFLKDISPNMCEALPFFHAYTGCDTVSAFHGVGKAKAWNVWKKMQEVMTGIFIRLSTSNTVGQDDFEKIQLFTVLMYDVTSQTETVNECRRILYTQENRIVENIPPTEEALRQHLKRAMLQSRIWRQCLELQPDIPSATSWGWKLSNSVGDANGIEPLWTLFPQASDECSELISCRCKTMCVRNCKCQRFNLQCTALCTCDGQCSQ